MMSKDFYHKSVFGTITISEDPVGIINIQQGNSKITITAIEFCNVIRGLYAFKKQLQIPQPTLAFTLPQFIPQLQSSKSIPYEKWTTEEESKLKEYYGKGLSIDEIANKLGRKVGGIRSRLKKLKLI